MTTPHIQTLLNCLASHFYALIQFIPGNYVFKLRLEAFAVVGLLPVSDRTSFDLPFGVEEVVLRFLA